MTKEEFIAGYCERSNIPWEWLSNYRHAVPCECGDKVCEGWAMVPLDSPNWRGFEVDEK